jgi:hypothetical protein
MALPPPQPQATISPDKEREMLDRRKNWVFMTPEEMMGTDTDKDSQKDSDSLDGKYDKNGLEKKSMTVMERYYQRLSDSNQEQKGTNQSNKFDADSWTKAGSSSNPGDGRPGINPFDSTPNTDLGVFRQTHTDNFRDVFGTGKSATSLTPEEVRSKAEQDAHMESFKQLWDIDQPQTTTAISTPTTIEPSSASVFGAQESQSGFNAMNSSVNNGFVSPNTPVQAPSTLSSMRSHSAPPRATFAPVSSPF